MYNDVFSWGGVDEVTNCITHSLIRWADSCKDNDFVEFKKRKEWDPRIAPEAPFSSKEMG